MTKDERFLRSAVALAEIWSKDPNRKVCAIAVGETPNQVAFGYNGFPPGVADTTERLSDQGLKRALTLHAEVNALANATFPVKTLYITHPPCESCALRILGARTVDRVVYLPQLMGEHWSLSLANARELLREAGVLLQRFEL